MGPWLFYIEQCGESMAEHSQLITGSRVSSSHAQVEMSVSRKRPRSVQGDSHGASRYGVRGVAGFDSGSPVLPTMTTEMTAGSVALALADVL
jgi:hypothetical protein